MTYENIKTVTLTILIILSGILTWGIWTFQPNYELMEKETTVNEVTLGSKREVKKIVKPHQVVFHETGTVYGTLEAEEIEEITAMVTKWKYYDVGKFSEHFSDLENGISRGDYTELIFPDEVPIDIYRKVLNFENNDLPKFEFDRIFVDTEVGNKQEGDVYFYSTKTQDFYSSHVSLASIHEFVNVIQGEFNKYIHLKSFDLPNGKNIYLPTEETKMESYTYYRNPIDPEELKNALFRDPSFVQKSIVSNGEEYADEASKMTVDYNTNLISYINPFRESEAVVGTENLVQKSIEFINSHSGWTDNYRYVFKDEFNRRVVFRMYTEDGYPIFNQIGMSEILQEWGQTEIKRYNRPSFYLEMPINPETRIETFPSGQEIMTLLMDKDGIDPEFIEDVALGYYMLNNPNDSSLIFLEPGWFYRYGDVWFRLTLESEVDGDGLE